MRKTILTTETSLTRRKVISAMVNNILIEVYNSGSIEQVGKEERKKWNGWVEEVGKGRQFDLKMGAEEAGKGRQFDLKMGTLKHGRQTYLYFCLLMSCLVVGQEPWGM